MNIAFEWASLFAHLLVWAGWSSRNVISPLKMNTLLRVGRTAVRSGSRGFAATTKKPSVKFVQFDSAEDAVRQVGATCGSSLATVGRDPHASNQEWYNVDTPGLNFAIWGAAVGGLGLWYWQFGSTSPAGSAMHPLEQSLRPVKYYLSSKIGL